MTLANLAQGWKELDPGRPKKIALVMAGAGSLGAYEAGVLIELSHALTTLNGQLDAAGEARFTVDVLTGASAGGMSAALFSRAMLGSFESEKNGLYEAWVERINIHDLLKPAADEENALLSKQILRDISGRYLASVPAGRKPASFLPPDSLCLGLTLSNLNGLDYQLAAITRSSVAGAGYNTTRFSDSIAWTIPCRGDGNVLQRGVPPFVRAGGPIVDAWSEVQTAAIACGNFPFAFMPQPLTRYYEEYRQDNLTQDEGYFQSYPQLTFVDGGMFDNEPLGAAINLAASRDPGGRPDAKRLFLLVHPNITRSAHRDGVGRLDEHRKYHFTPYTDPALSLGEQLGRLVEMLMTENAVSDWVRAHQVNSLLGWRKKFLAELVRIVSTSEVGDPPALERRLTALGLEIAGTHGASDPKAYLEAALDRVLADSKAELSLGGLPPDDAAALHQAGQRQEIYKRIIFILDHVSDLQEKRPLRLEVIGRDPEAPPLAGQSINGFAGFFEIAWREYDYRRGRCDAHTALQQILGSYPPEAAAAQPTAGRPPLRLRPGVEIGRADDYNCDTGAWRRVWPRFPEVAFKDLADDDQEAIKDRILDRAKTALGISGLLGWLFGLVIKGKVESILTPNEK